MGINTEYCSDSNGNAEFKCECNEGFVGKRCEDECFLECGIHGSCTTDINTTTGIKQRKCLCRDNFTGFIDGHYYKVESFKDYLCAIYTSLLKIGSPKNREFREILPFSKTCNFLKIRNFEELRRFPKHAIS